MIPGHHWKHLSQTCPCYLRVFLLCGSGRSEPLAGLSRILAAKVRPLWAGPAWPSQEAALIISPPGRGIRTLEAAPRARQCFPVLLTPNRAFGGFPGGTRAKESACQCRRHERLRFNPCVRKIPWRRAWQPTPVCSPGETQGKRSPVGYSSWGHKESDTTEAT